jgi:sensor c-di-GMP phosphodiesterase-like protein
MDKEKKEKWASKHGDTIAIIGVNAAFFILLVTMWISHASRMDAANTRMDAMNIRIDNTLDLIHKEFKNFQDEAKAFHGRLCILEEKTKEK